MPKQSAKVFEIIPENRGRRVSQRVNYQIPSISTATPRIKNAGGFSGTSPAWIPRVKKWLVLILVVFLGYMAYQKTVARKRDRLIGTWKMERNYQGVAVKFIMDLKPTGDVSVEVDGSYGPRIISKDAFGNWQYTGSSFFVTFIRGEIPDYLNGKKYGGKILALDDRRLSYNSINGVETWERIR